MIIAFSLWGYDVTVLELVAVALALAAVALGVKGHRLTWPPYLASSVLYGVLFWRHALYASAALQLVFVAAAAWGWRRWGATDRRSPGLLPLSRRLVLVAVVLAGWALLAPLLVSTGGAGSRAEAFLLVGSLSAQVLMVKRYVEAWPVWIVVDAVGALHYASQGLWFTSLLYLLLTGMAVAGWQAWSAQRRVLAAKGAAPEVAT
jgi:nicotinamide mononucleotide transporter